MSKRARSGSFSFTSNTQTADLGGSSSSQSRTGSGRRSQVSRKYKGKPRGMSASSVYNAIKRYDWKSRPTKMISASANELPINTISTTIQLVNFPVPALGPAANQRIGNRISGVGIKINCLLHNNAALPVYVRMVILKIPQGFAYTDGEIRSEFYDLSTPGTSIDTNSAASGRLDDITRQINRGEIVVIRDKVIVLNGTSVDTGVSLQDIYVRTPHDINFPDGDFTEPTNDRYVCAFIPRQTNADESTGSTVEISYAVTCYFKDK